MKVRYHGLELLPSSAVYPLLSAVFDWIKLYEEHSLAAGQLLHTVRQQGFCFCETVYGCVACKGRGDMQREEALINAPLEVQPYLRNGPYVLLHDLMPEFEYKLIPIEDGRVAVVIDSKG